MTSGKQRLRFPIWKVDLAICEYEESNLRPETITNTEVFVLILLLRMCYLFVCLFTVGWGNVLSCVTPSFYVGAGGGSSYITEPSP